MEYQVPARKHRPMTSAEVTGQTHVVRTLTNALASGRTAHAYLFSGMRGVGKTTMARILAKALNCEKGPTPTPCLTCVSCREIGAGMSFDVMEIDGASSNSVDDVREMRETVRTAPAHGRYRVYIIDEVHMLSAAAFNALLKTLEEPPAHVVFVFATTEAHKIPPTILSRCQHFTFRRIPRREVVDTLKRVTAAEGIMIDDRSLSALDRASDGSLRDALSLLDQAVAFGGKRVEADQLMILLGAVPHELLRGVLEAVLARNAAGALKALAAGQEQAAPSPARPEAKIAPAPPKVAPQAAPLSKASEPGPAAAPRAERPQPIREATPPPPARPEPVNLDWEAVVARILAERPNVGAFLEESGLVGVAGDLVTVGFPAAAGTALKMMQQESYQQAGAEACPALAGRDLP